MRRARRRRAAADLMRRFDGDPHDDARVRRMERGVGVLSALVGTLVALFVATAALIAAEGAGAARVALAFMGAISLWTVVEAALLLLLARRRGPRARMPAPR